ncbi:MAG TPA: hypothetical protein VF796_13270, partial [Humisphaera sp.]
MAETKVVPPTATPTHKPFAAVLEKAAGKDKANLQKQLDALAALPVPAHAQTWQQLVATLAGLAPHALQTVGKEAVRFFVADGRYKLQVYAIEDKRDGHIAVYLPDVLEQAIKKKIVAPTKSPTEFALPGSRGETIVIDSLNGDNTMDAPAHFKFMIGLGRKALRVTVAAAGRPAQVAAAEALCQLA